MLRIDYYKSCLPKKACIEKIDETEHIKLLKHFEMFNRYNKFCYLDRDKANILFF